MDNARVKYFSTNSNGRDLIVGDLHGCFSELMAMLGLLKFDTAVDRLFSVGDLVDRGPDSMRTLELLYEDWFHAVKGNHEQMMCDSVIRGDLEQHGVWLCNGGTWCIDVDKQLLVDAAKKADALPLVIVVGEGNDRFNIVHAELIAHGAMVTNQTIDDWLFAEYDENSLTWGRSMVRKQKHAPPCYQTDELSLTFVGHTPVGQVIKLERQIFLDTGAVYYHASTNKSETRKLTMAAPKMEILYQFNMFHQKLSIVPFEDIEVHA